MIWMWVLVGAVAILFVWFWRWGSEAAPIHFTDPGTMRQALRWVVLRGVHKRHLRGHLEIFIGGASKPALVFTKTKYSDGEFGVTATVHANGLQVDAGKNIPAALTAKGISFDPSDPGSVSVEVVKDFGLALVLLQTMCVDVAGKKVETDCIGYLRDVVVTNAPSLTGIDAPNEELFK